MELVVSVFGAIGSFLFGKGRRSYRPRPGDDRVKREEARYLSHLRRKNLSKWLQVMEARLGIDDKPRDSLEELLVMTEKLDRLKRAGLLGEKPADAVDRLIDQLPDIVKALPNAAQAVSTMRQPTPAPAEPERQLPPAEQPQAGQQPPQEEPTMGIPVEWKIKLAQAELARRNPEQAAAWLLGLDDDVARAVVDGIRKAPEGDLMAALDRWAADEPKIKGLVAWLKGREAWTLEVARHIRDAGSPPAGGRTAF